jgi:hypothetical protein
MKLFHGTTIENALAIVQNGFSYEKSNWNCSESKTYFFTSQHFKEEFGLETDEEVMDYALQEAFQQSLIGLALENPQDYRGAVLVFDTDLMNNQDLIEPDLSCPNMGDRAVELANPDMQGLVAVYVMTESLSAYRLFTLASLRMNDYLKEVELNSMEQQLVDSIAKSRDVLSSAYEITSQLSYEQMTINQTNTGLKAA